MENLGYISLDFPPNIYCSIAIANKVRSVANKKEFRFELIGIFVHIFQAKPIRCLNF